MVSVIAVPVFRYVYSLVPAYVELDRAQFVRVEDPYSHDEVDLSTLQFPLMSFHHHDEPKRNQSIPVLYRIDVRMPVVIGCHHALISRALQFSVLNFDFLVSFPLSRELIFVQHSSALQPAWHRNH